MGIKNTQNISFGSFFRNSPPCMDYLAKNFDGNQSKFNKALEILDNKCSKHKYFDMFYSQENNSIKIVPKNESIENYFFTGPQKFMSIPEGERYTKIAEILELYGEPKKKTENLFIKKIKNIFSLKKAKKYVNSGVYNKIPSNVREAVDIIEKMEHSLK